MFIRSIRGESSLRRSNERLQRIVASRVRLLREAVVQNHTLVELGRRKDERAAVAVHDLKNPLSVIISSYEYILEGLECSADCREALQDCRRAAQVMLGLLAKLVDVGHVEGDVPEWRRSDPEHPVPQVHGPSVDRELL
jgi:signal transduction histidine kinase